MGNALQSTIEQLQRQATHRTQMVALRSNNGSYVCAEGGGADALVANRPAIGRGKPSRSFGSLMTGWRSLR
jgi:hypothetical protein